MNNKNNSVISKIKNKLANNYLIFLFWALVVFLSSIITITQGFSLLRDFYRSHFLIKEDLYSKLEKLYPNTNIDYLKGILGTPQLVKASQSNKNSDKKEYIFINNYYYVQAIVDNIGTVLSVAITSRDKQFKPTFIDPSWNDGKRETISVNRTSFYEYSKEQGDCIIIAGARRYGYYEEFYLANPGNYQTIIVGLNDSSQMNLKEEDYKVFSDSFINSKWDCSKIPQSFRKTPINTFIITAPFVDYKDIKDFTLGVNYDEVRVFKTN